MKRFVHILLVVSCLIPLVGVARDETLEERKRRIMRKYLRESTTTVQSGIVVPEDEEPEEDSVQSSERFSQADIGIAREEGGVTMPPPMPRRPIPAPADKNWLLATEDETETDLYGMPKAAPSAKTPVSQWEYQDGRQSQPTASRSSWGQSSENQNSRSSFFGSRTEGSSSIFSQPSGQDDNQSSSIFGFQQNKIEKVTPNYESPLNRISIGTDRSERRDGSFGSDGATFGSDGRTFGSDGREQIRGQGFTSQRIPYQTPSRVNGVQQPGTTEQPTIPQPSSYQKWKQKKPVYDPMRDDAFLNEHMPKFGN